MLLISFNLSVICSCSDLGRIGGFNPEVQLNFSSNSSCGSS